MGLRIIYGRAGSGKSSYLYEEIVDKIKNNEKQKIYIITPEQFSFTAEQKLMEANKAKNNSIGVTKAEVLTLSRMAYRMENDMGKENKKKLTASGKAMLIYEILLKEKKNLKFLGKSEENIELLERQFTELKKHKVTIEDLKNAKEISNDKYLKTKLNDILIVYENYEKRIQSNYIDENDSLTYLANKLIYSDMFYNTSIYIDEFVGFTKQEYDVLRNLMKKAKQMTVTITTDDFNNLKPQETDIFYSNKKCANRLIEIAKQEGVQIEETVKLDNHKKRFHNSELEHLEQNLYEITPTKYEKENENIKLFLAENQYSEIEMVASKIVNLVRENDYHYRDIAVITKNLDTYASLCKVIFAKYDIPVFIDENKELSSNLLARYVTSILDVFAKNWKTEDVLSFAKSPFVNIDNDYLYKLENYVTRWGIKGKKWYDGVWALGDDENDKIENARNSIITPLLSLKEKLNISKDVRNVSKAIYEFLIEQNINEKLDNKIDELEKCGELELAKEYEGSFDIILQILDEIVSIFGDEKMSFDKYSKLLKIGLSKSSLGKIPSTQDNVMVGNVDRSRSHKVKAVFIIGINDGVFPSVNKDEGFLGDKEREDLKQIGVELAKGTLERLYEDNFNIYKAFTTAEEKLFLSYSSSDSEGRALRQSMIITKLKKIFPKLKQTSNLNYKQDEVETEKTTFEKLLFKLREFQDDGKKLDDIWFYIFNYYYNSPKWSTKLQSAMQGIGFSNLPDILTKENIDKLYGDTLKTSVSKLEKYRECPFSYYLKYGLKLSDKGKFKVESVDTGNMMHEVIDEFFENLKQLNISIRDLNKEEIDEIIEKQVEKIVEEKLGLKKNYIFTQTAKYRMIAVRLKRTIKKSIKYIVETLRQSKFDIYANELEFGSKSENPPIKFSLEDGKKVELTGKIDRIDLAKTNEGKYIRIIDYKSSVKNLELNEVVAGLNLQLLTYMDEMCKTMDDVIPAGTLYFNLIDPVIKASKDLSEESLEAEIRKKFKMQGLILADVDVVKMMDIKLEKGSSSLIPVYIDKDGNISNSRSNAVKRKEFEDLLNFTNKMIKEISKEILSGKIELKPVYRMKNKKKPCDYCEYRSICQFTPGFCQNQYKYIWSKEKGMVLNEIKKE